ncbi:MAG TPA: sigma-70 family RNA polymerase sigma factor [Polyangiaceae bacterium]|nr:sigma-70 family RNA polymerase sigma factor [Polyangiaceae bacterium]
MTESARARGFRLIPGGADSSARSPSPEPDSRKAEVAALSDLQLLQAVRDGNGAAASLFHDRMRPLVDRTLMRLLGGHDPDYDDLAQQALIELVMSVDRFRGECPLDAWASIIVARVVYKQIRRRRSERKVIALDAGESREIADRRPQTGLALRSALRRIERHLAAIEDNKAWAFVLHDVHGYDLEEISSIMGVSRAAAQSRLVRGRKLLHERLSRDPELRDVLDALAPTLGGRA